MVSAGWTALTAAAVCLFIISSPECTCSLVEDNEDGVLNAAVDETTACTTDQKYVAQVFQDALALLDSPSASEDNQAKAAEMIESALELVDTDSEAAGGMESMGDSNPALVGAASRELAEIMLRGVPGRVTRDYSRALGLFQKAANCSDPVALHFMAFAQGTVGSMLLGVPEDETAAVVAEETAALIHRYPPAMIAMGYRFLHGVGIAKDCESSLLLYKDSAEALLAGLEPQGMPAFGPPDEPLLSDSALEEEARYAAGRAHALRHYLTRALNGDPEDLFEAGWIYLLGDWVEKDYGTAASYFHAAAMKGHKPSMSVLGTMFAVGQGVPKDFDAGVDLLQHASQGEDGDSLARVTLGYLTLRGLGVDINPDKAQNLFMAAAEDGEPAAYYFLGEHLLAEGDFVAATEYFRTAASAKHLFGAERVAYMHEMGLGIPRSCDAAAHLYKMVAEAALCSLMRERGEGEINLESERAMFASA
ncbi:unnamed protein product, partial [Discosporangium mesarthrocarpum]